MLRRFLRRADGSLRIELAHDSEPERRIRDALLGRLQRHDLSRWQFTSRMRIDERARVPHSHPVLTLNTAPHYLNDDGLLLATYLHEQLHRFVARRGKQQRAALRELRERYPDTPAAPPDGAGNARSSYLHYVVCYLEYVALMEVAGADEARRVLDFWTTHHYTAIYRRVLDDADAIGAIVERHGLMP